MQRARNNKPMTIKQAWEEMTKLPAAVRDKEQICVLWKFLKNPDDDAWINHMVTVSEELTRSHTQQIRKETLTKGQLEVQHGRAEARELIAKGKWKKTVDQDGDEVYERVQKAEELSRSRTTTISGTRHSEYKYSKLHQTLCKLI